MSALRLDRRSFLKVSGTAAGGLLVGFYVRSDARAQGAAAFRPNGYVRIDADGTRDALVEESRHGAGHQDEPADDDRRGARRRMVVGPRRAGGAQPRLVRRAGRRRQRRHAVGRPARPARRRGRARAAGCRRGKAVERRAVGVRHRARRRAPSRDRALGCVQEISRLLLRRCRSRRKRRRSRTCAGTRSSAGRCAAWTRRGSWSASRSTASMRGCRACCTR